MLACASCIVGFVCRETWPCDPLVNCRLLCVFGANSLLGIARYRERCKELEGSCFNSMGSIRHDLFGVLYYTCAGMVFFFIWSAS